MALGLGGTENLYQQSPFFIIDVFMIVHQVLLTAKKAFQSLMKEFFQGVFAYELQLTLNCFHSLQPQISQSTTLDCDTGA